MAAETHSHSGSITVDKYEGRTQLSTHEMSTIQLTKPTEPKE